MSLGVGCKDFIAVSNNPIFLGGFVGLGNVTPTSLQGNVLLFNSPYHTSTKRRRFYLELFYRWYVYAGVLIFMRFSVLIVR
jgi:hypothetical protein